MKEMFCEICNASSKETEVHFSRKYNMYLCTKHRHHYDRFGEPKYLTQKDKNEVLYYPDHAEIILRNSKGVVVGKTLINKEDVDRCLEHKWRLTYANEKSGGAPNVSCLMYNHQPLMVSLSRFILNYNGPLEVDHINRNRLDNRRENLRIVDRYTNAANKECLGYQKHGNSYRVLFRRRDVVYNLGSFKTKEEAAFMAEKVRKDYENDPDKLKYKEYIISISYRKKGTLNELSNVSDC